MDQEKIGKFIAKCRKDKNLTQEQLAEKLGVSNRTISNWENGKYLPDYSILLPLSKELDITIIELISGEKQEQDEKEIKKYIEYLEKIISFISLNRKVNIAQCQKIGKILFIGGILICLFSLFLLPRSPLDSWIFILSGSLILLLGFSYLNKKYHYKKRIKLNIIAFLILIISISTCELINVVVFNDMPKLAYCGYVNSSVYCEGLLFDTYRCDNRKNKDNKYHIIRKGYAKVHGDTLGPFDYCD